MNIKKIHKIVDSTDEPLKIIDQALHTGVITKGNENDYVNLLSKVYPNSESDEALETLDKLKNLPFDEGAQIDYSIDSESTEENSIKVGKFYLNFKLK